VKYRARVCLIPSICAAAALLYRQKRLDDLSRFGGNDECMRLEHGRRSTTEDRRYPPSSKLFEPIDTY